MIGGSATDLSEFLEFYVLLYAPYAWQLFCFQIKASPYNRLIYCHCLGVECRHLHRWTQVTIQLPPRDAIGCF
jgi:hypothetical protein